jgi:hypothetical protein
MAGATLTQPRTAPQRYMQGIAVPASSVRGAEFMARTRRQTLLEGARAYAGLGLTDTFELKKSGIIAGIYIRFTGNLVIALPTGTAAATFRWPYDLIKAVRFTANGQANIINCSGLKLKAREAMGNKDIDDRGVSNSFNGATITQGSLALASELWGVGANATAIPANTYPVDLCWFVPVAEDQIDLNGAIFAATSSTDLTLAIDWEAAANLFALTGTATATLTGTVQVETQKYTIPIGADGEIVVPDLSSFHSLIQSRVTGLAAGANELRLIGQGAGKTLLRTYFQVFTGAAPAVTPLAMNDTNYGELAWRYGSNETPEDVPTGQLLRYVNERTYNVDVGGRWGFGAWDFAAANAFRDAVDMGNAAELRLLITLAGAPTTPAVEIVQETIFAAGAGG